jgi:phosphohistidine phosphatase
MTEERHLYVLRHAKSAWDDPDVPDHARPLAPRGREATRVMAQHMRAADIDPALILCSSARRARETLSGIGLPDRADGRTLIEPGLYEAGAEEIIERLRQVAAHTSSVMVIGHNPTMQSLVLMLAGTGETAEVAHKFPTCALATLRLRGPWSELKPGTAVLTAFVRPKALQPR